MPVIEVRKKIGDVFVSLIKGAGDIVNNTVDVTRIATAYAIQQVSIAKAAYEKLLSSRFLNNPLTLPAAHDRYFYYLLL